MPLGTVDGVPERTRQTAELARIPVVLIAKRTSGEIDFVRRLSRAVVYLWEAITLDRLFKTIQSIVFARAPWR